MTQRSDSKPYLSAIHLWALGAAATWVLCASVMLERNYQDSWVLEGLLAPMAALFGAYLWCAAREERLGHLAAATAVFAFVMSAAPALKYAMVYSSSIDSAVHLASVRTLAETGRVDPLSAYVDTPGFHALAAAIGQLAGLPSEDVLKVLPSLLGASIPLGFAMLAGRLRLEPGLARAIVVLSAVSLPLMYIVLGTQFTLPLFVALVLFFVLREGGEGLRVPYTLLVILLLAAITLWHPSTSFVFILVFGGAGLIAQLGRRRERSGKLLAVAFLGAALTLTYWMYSADYVYSKFIKNISLALQPFTGAELVPRRLFEISVEDRVVIGLLTHARDATVLLLALIGLGLLLRRGAGAVSPALRLYASLWLSTMGVLAGVFVFGFGGQGYTRFLLFAVALSPVLAGYGLWRALSWARERLAGALPARVLGTALPAIFALAALQIFPYQLAVPTLRAEHDLRYSPVVWLHQVNTVYQERMLSFALERLPPGPQIVGDYIGARQPILFFDMAQLGRVRTLSDGVRELPAYFLLHAPGRAGGYMEQVEHRSAEAIDRLRMAPGVSTIYDNGGSFVLYYPGSARELAMIEGWR